MNIEIASSVLQPRYPISPAVRAVLFDAVGTLIYPQPTVAEAYWAAGRRFGSRLEVAEVRTRFRASFRRQEELDQERARHRTSQQHERCRWQAIVGEVFDDVADVDALFAALWDHFAQAANWALFDDVQCCWQELSKAGLRLAVASNFDERLPEIVAASAPLSAAERVFVSSLLGCRKPCREFFRSIEHSLGLRPEQLLLVGDDLENDYQGALSSGWHAVLLMRESDTQSAAEHRITSLRQLHVAC